MTLEERLNYCKICTNRKMDFNTGILCRISGEKPAFEGECESFNADEVQIKHYKERQAVAEAEENEGAFAPERKGLQKGILGGIVMMLIAVVWFVVGWQAGRIFFYPPILFVIGLVGLIKGMIQGNFSGKD